VTRTVSKRLTLTSYTLVNIVSSLSQILNGYLFNMKV